MVLGGLRCPEEVRSDVLERIHGLKTENGKNKFSELKWNRVSKATLPLYLDVVNYFFDKEELFFRAIVIDKHPLNHEAYNQTHDEFYYKIYYRLLERMIDSAHKYRIFLDIKDTQGKDKVSRLKEFLCNSQHDFQGEMIEHIQEVRSHEVALLQIVDVIIGAIQYANRYPDGGASAPKNKLVEHIKQRSGLSLKHKTWPGAEKFNLLIWESNGNV